MKNFDFDALLSEVEADKKMGFVEAGPSEMDLQLLQAATNISQDSDSTEREHSLLKLKTAIENGATMKALTPNGMRAVDVLARGLDSEQAVQAFEILAESGLAQDIMSPPNASEMPPMMAACYLGSSLIVNGLLELGMPADIQVNIPRLKLLGATPFHATVLGYREIMKDDYGSVLSSLLRFCPEGLDIKDRLQQTPLELTIKAAAITNDDTLLNAILSYGVEFGDSKSCEVERIVRAFANRRGDVGLLSVMSQGSAHKALREMEEFRASSTSVAP